MGNAPAVSVMSLGELMDAAPPVCEMSLGELSICRCATSCIPLLWIEDEDYPRCFECVEPVCSIVGLRPRSYQWAWMLWRVLCLERLGLYGVGSD